MKSLQEYIDSVSNTELTEAELAEYSWGEFKSDAGDAARGFAQGASLGTYDNIAAGVQSALGPDTYKQALAQQTAATKQAQTRSPYLYGAGNVAGAVAMPVPGGAVASGLIKGAGLGAKAARGVTTLGTNIAAQSAIDTAKTAADTRTLGYDPNKYPTTPQEIVAFQQANGLKPDGIIGPQTQAVLTKLGLTQPMQQSPQPSLAESIKLLQDRLKTIEESTEEFHTVWLLEDGTVIDQDGNIVDESLLSDIEWQQLDEAGLPAAAWNLAQKAGSNIANVGKNFLGGLGGKMASGTAKSADDIAAAQAATNAARVAKGQKAFTPAQLSQQTAAGIGTKNAANIVDKGANKAGQLIAKNPGKATAAAGALGAAAGANLAGGDQGAQAAQGAKKTGTGTKAGGAGFTDLGAQYGYNSPEEVQQIQQQLVSMGYPIAVDGKFGPKTAEAYKQAYSQMYGQQPGQTDPNAPVPQNYQQGQTAKQDLSKDMAAAVGMPNPYAKAPAAAATAPAQQPATPGSNFDANGHIIGMPPQVTSAAAPQGRDASGKPYTDWTGDNPEPGTKGVINYNENAELSRIITLANLNKN